MHLKDTLDRTRQPREWTRPPDITKCCTTVRSSTPTSRITPSSSAKEQQCLTASGILGGGCCAVGGERSGRGSRRPLAGHPRPTSSGYVGLIAGRAPAWSAGGATTSTRRRGGRGAGDAVASAMGGVCDAAKLDDVRVEDLTRSVQHPADLWVPQAIIDAGARSASIDEVLHAEDRELLRIRPGPRSPRASCSSVTLFSPSRSSSRTRILVGWASALEESALKRW